MKNYNKAPTIFAFNILKFNKFPFFTNFPLRSIWKQKYWIHRRAQGKSIFRESIVQCKKKERLNLFKLRRDVMRCRWIRKRKFYKSAKKRKAIYGKYLNDEDKN